MSITQDSGIPLTTNSVVSAPLSETEVKSAAPSPDRELKIFRPPKNAEPSPELPESVYKLSPNEIKQLYQSQVERRQDLENRPLETQKMRNAKETEKLKKYPKTTIRIRMLDQTIVQAVFQSEEQVSTLYNFVKSLLETPDRKFVLCLPPRTNLVTLDTSLFKAGLSPASNVIFGWTEKVNGVSNGNTLKKEYMDMSQNLQATSSPSSDDKPTENDKSESKSSTTSSSKKVPKWLLKGLLNKK